VPLLDKAKPKNKTAHTMNITLRKKKLKDNRISLYLDYYLPEEQQKRRKESLKLYLKSNPRTPKERESNKQTLTLAENIKSKRLLELQHKHHDFSHLIEEKKNEYVDIVSYFEKMVIAQRRKTQAVKTIWNSSLYNIKSFCGTQTVLLKSITKEWLEEYKYYLLHEAKCQKIDRSISQNSAQHYFGKLKVCLSQADKENLIPFNPFCDVKGISKRDSVIEYLTLEEIQQVALTPCKNPLYKRAFLFGCLTGMRWSDIKNLQWINIHHSKANGYSISYRQQKTDKRETLPVADQAIELIGGHMKKNGFVFENLVYTKLLNPILQDWMEQSGIHKKITFHCSRHTYATTQLTLGTDIYTISKLLGHREVSTTQVYAKVVNQTKIEAVHRIPKIKVA